jgi:gas vesicle protein
MAEHDDFRTAEQAVHEVAEKASELADEVGNQVEEAARNLRQEAGGLPQYVDEAARDLRSMMRQTEDLARRRPELVLAGSVLGGLALARVFKSSSARCAIGIGVGWLLVRHARSGGAGLYEGTPAEQARGGYATGRRGTYPGTRADADGLMGDPYSGRVSRVTNAVKEQVSRAAETVKEQAERVRQRTREKVQRAGAAARTVVESAEEAAAKAGAPPPGPNAG